MGRGMVRLYLLAPDPVYRGGYGVSDLEIAPFDTGPEHLVVPGGDGVETLELSALGGDPTQIRHLTAARGIERVLLQHDVELSLGVGYELDGEYGGLDLLPFVAHEPALYLLVPERGDHSLVPLHRLPGPLPLLVPRRLETRLVERDLPLRQHLSRDLDRKTIGVMQQKRHLAREVSSCETTNLGLKEIHPRMVDVYEARRLAAHDPAYVLPGRPQLLVEVANAPHDHLGETSDLLGVHTQPRIRLPRRPAYYASKNVLVALISGPDAVGDEEGHSPRVVG